ncbi:FtsX-like permease family protein [Actinocrispum sp. NPDC049592]|uniref:ABC transporter permease n=1 Tax=Actinocrispum sp. NPDC049592 TaxID=3154835 RepID=UPI0034175049
MTGWRTAIRVAWREAKRAKGRSALIVAMITVPVMALVFMTINFDTFELSPAEQATRLMGTGQAAVVWPFDSAVRQEPGYLNAYPVNEAIPSPDTPAEQQLLAQFPAGTKAIPDLKSQLDVHTADGIGSLTARQLDYANPLAEGILRPVSGRAPSADNEVSLTPAASTRLGVGVGGTFKTADDSQTFTVTGIVEDPQNLDASTIVVHRLKSGVDRQDARWLVGTPNPLSWNEVKQLNTHGIVAVSRDVLVNPPPKAEEYDLPIGRGARDNTALVLVGGLALIEVMLLAGAAFAVGAKRRRRDLALVAASGGTPAQVRRIVLADGVVHGTFAAVLGVGLGTAGAAVFIPVIEDTLTRQRAGSLQISLVSVLILTLAAVATGVLAALVPAWISSRQNVVMALAGRRGITRTRRRWPIAGAAIGLIGVGMSAFGALQTETGLVLSGLVVVELALVFLTPSLVGLVARLGRWLPPVARLALRDASRNRTAAAPAIAAVAAAVIGSLTAAIAMVSIDQREHETTSMALGNVFVMGAQTDKLPSFQQADSALRAAMPVKDVFQVSGLDCGGLACLPFPKVPADRACPYVGKMRELTTDEQKAAAQDPKCANIREDNNYFGVLSVGGLGMSLAVAIQPEAAGAVSGVSDEDAAIASAALREGKVVVDDATTVDNGSVTLTLMMVGRQSDPNQTVTAPAVALPHRPRAGITMMTPETARSLGLGVKPLGALATSTRMPTVNESDRLRSILGNEFRTYVERGSDSQNSTLTVLVIVAAIVTLGAAALATGLAAADGKADLSTLAAIGASPRVRRLLSLSQSGVIAGLGSTLGAVTGMGAAVAVLTAFNQGLDGVWPAPPSFPIVIPWISVLITVIVVPVAAMLGAGLLTRSRLPIEDRL